MRSFYQEALEYSYPERQHLKEGKGLEEEILGFVGMKSFLHLEMMTGWSTWGCQDRKIFCLEIEENLVVCSEFPWLSNQY